MSSNLLFVKDGNSSGLDPDHCSVGRDRDPSSGTSEKLAGTAQAITRQKLLTFRPSVDDPEQLTAYLRSVSDKYKTLRSSTSERHAHEDVSLMHFSGQHLQGTLSSAGATPLLSVPKQPPLDKKLAPSSADVIPGAQLTVSGASPSLAALQQQIIGTRELKQHQQILCTSSASLATKKKPPKESPLSAQLNPPAKTAPPRPAAANSKQPGKKSNYPAAQGTDPSSQKSSPKQAKASRAPDVSTASSKGTGASSDSKRKGLLKSKKRKTRTDGPAADVLDADTRARIQRVTANPIDYNAPDPERDTPPGETEDERRKRLERINGRRKRAKKFIEIDQYHQQITELSQNNQKLRSDNVAFRERIDLIQDMLKQGKTPSQELLCLPGEPSTKSVAEAPMASEPSAGNVSEPTAQVPPQGAVAPQHAVRPSASPSTSVASAPSNIGDGLQQLRHQYQEHQSTEALTSTGISNFTRTAGHNQSPSYSAAASNSNQLQQNALLSMIQNQYFGESNLAASLPVHLWQQLSSSSAQAGQGGSSHQSVPDTNALLLQQHLLQSLHDRIQHEQQEQQQQQSLALATSLLQNNPSIAEALMQQSQSASLRPDDAYRSQLADLHALMARQHQHQHQQYRQYQQQPGEYEQQRQQNDPHQGFPPQRGNGQNK